MRWFAILLIAALPLGGRCLAAESGPSSMAPEDRQSYSLGYQFGEGLRTQGFDQDLELLIEGIRDAVGGRDGPLSLEERNDAILELKKKLVAARKEKRERRLEENLKRATAFLEENGKLPGVVTLPSGLQYKVLAEGTGRSPAIDDTVTVHYRGRLVDGTEFDSSYARGKPETVRVDGILAGWTEALQRMREGAKWELFVPPDLGYGVPGRGTRILPNSALIFDLELLSVQ